MIDGAGAAVACKMMMTSTFRADSMGIASARLSSKIYTPQALVLFVLMAVLPTVGGVRCAVCMDTIAPAHDSDACPLIKVPGDNSVALGDLSSTALPKMQHVLPPELLCTFTKSVMETLSAVTKAPKGGGDGRSQCR